MFLCVLRVFIVLVDFRLHCVTTVTHFIRRSQGWSLRSGRDPGRVAPKTVLFRGNSNPLQFLQLQPKRETSSSSLRYRLEKSFILSLPNRLCDYQLICIWNKRPRQRDKWHLRDPCTGKIGQLRDGPLEKWWGGRWGIFTLPEFFLEPFPMQEFFFFFGYSLMYEFYFF